MYVKTGTALAASLVIASCSGGAERPAGEDVSAGSLQGADTAGPRDLDAMTGMDHSGMMGMPGANQTEGGQGMVGMDHSQVPGMAGAGAQDHAGAMEHAQMTGMPGAGAQADAGVMDHAQMPGAPGAGTQDHADAMDHSRMPAMSGAGGPASVGAAMTADDAAAEKLRALVAELVQDSVVQARIQANPALRERWADEGVRSAVLSPP